MSSYLDVESAPVHEEPYGADPYEDRPVELAVEINDDLRTLPVAVLNKIAVVADQVDNAACESPDCSAAIGFALREDYYGRETATWCWTTIWVADDGSVTALCEDCGVQAAENAPAARPLLTP